MQVLHEANNLKNKKINKIKEIGQESFDFYLKTFLIQTRIGL